MFFSKIRRRLCLILSFEKFSRGFYFYFKMNGQKFSSRAKGVNCNKLFKRGNASRNSHSNCENLDQNLPKRPPGLKGKEIGLWYRDRSRQKKLGSVSVALERRKVKKIENVLLEAALLTQKTGNSKNQRDFEQKFLRDRSTTFEEKLNQVTVDVIKEDTNLDNELYHEFKDKLNNNSEFKKMLKFRMTLPAFNKKDEIVDVINRNQVVVISGETGSGKTTQAAQFVLDNYISEGKGSLYQAICTQPRRISAITVAERVAAERAEKLGISIGYAIRLQSEMPKRKRGTITFVTTGILIQWLQSNPILNGVSHLFVDEIHERDTFCDFLLALLKLILQKRPDLKIILMSATLNAEKFSEYFSGAPLIEIPGITHPVKEYYLEDILQKVPFRFSTSRVPKFPRAKKLVDLNFTKYVLPYVNKLERSNQISKTVAAELRNPESENLNIDLIIRVILHICTNEDEGAVLVFVPGLAQIQDVIRSLNNHSFFTSSKAKIVPMHSIMTTVSQKQAFDTPPRGVRKIIISTTICETSITINDVRYVIDCGKNKTRSFDLSKNVETLEPEWETAANAKQRKGRAGRTQSGKCYKLYTKAREDTFELYPLPDIQKCRLDEVILSAKTLQLGRIEPFLDKLMDPPDPKVIKISLKMLTTLDLLDKDERLTPLGYHVSKLPLNPQTGKMILMGALFSCLDPVLSIAACLSYKDPFEFVFGKEHLIRERRKRLSKGEKSDHFMLSNAVISWEEARNENCEHQFAYDHFLSNHNLKLISKMKKQFASYLHDMKFIRSNDPKDPRSNVNSYNNSLIKAIVCSGLYPNVAMIKRIINKINGEPKRILWQTMDHPRVELHMKSLLESQKKFESPFIVYFEKIKSSAIFLYDATMVYPMALLFFGEKCDIVEDHGYYIVVDDMIKFLSTKQTAVLVQQLRKQLLWILEEAVTHPGVIDWTVKNQKTLILKSIVELITSEDKTSLDEFGVEFSMD